MATAAYGVNPDKFWARVKKGRACWLWTGARQSKKGVPQYGNLKVGKRWQAAHRVAWALKYGKEPGRMWVLHKCDNPVCVNPDHLFLGTVLDNNRDMWSKGRGVSNLPPHGNARLTEKQVLRIRKLYSRGIVQTKLAKMFKTDQTNISRITRGAGWKHVE